MSSGTAVRPADKQHEARPAAAPRPCRLLAAAGLAGVLLTAALTVATGAGAHGALVGTPWGGGTTWALTAAATAGVLVLLWPALGAWRAAAASAGAWSAGRAADARREAAKSRESAWTSLGWCLAAGTVLGLVWFLLANDRAVQRTFLDGHVMSLSFADITNALGTNLFIAVVAQVLVMVWGLALALARLAPGRAGRPLRLLAVAYIDLFRAVPAIIIIYLVGFGLPLAEVPVLSDLSPTWFAIIALTLTYGAYVAEVYRAGIDGVHAGQTAAARSLGLSHGATLRYVVVPQAGRRVVPPLLNDFISLQKDTALVNVIGTIDAFNQSKIFAANHFNLSSVTVVAVLFIVMTIPQARLVDHLVARDARARAKGA
ncbi:amino acid ABC transporter permease [Yinghuangia seranimata]|uniref:amino acid ABC transporter permease n=1 Tax=Yinghuangia seranimata TaxID=408067 RepID=UPI00248AADF0|nr:amino acid ABC transporter permease [Yinghuangia seranimata]MDI2125308.1 amino acid ABC transporter permease [Yinghuangia seranimata]